MEINSRIFGKIEIDDNKIITIPNGLLGFEKYTRYVIAYDSDKESKNSSSLIIVLALYACGWSLLNTQPLVLIVIDISLINIVLVLS